MLNIHLDNKKQFLVFTLTRSNSALNTIPKKIQEPDCSGRLYFLFVCKSQSIVNLFLLYMHIILTLPRDDGSVSKMMHFMLVLCGFQARSWSEGDTNVLFVDGVNGPQAVKRRVFSTHFYCLRVRWPECLCRAAVPFRPCVVVQ